MRHATRRAPAPIPGMRDRGRPFREDRGEGKRARSPSLVTMPFHLTVRGLALLGLSFLGTSCSDPLSSGAAPAASGKDVLALFGVLQPGAGKVPADIEALLDGSRTYPQDDPNWPTVTYLIGEAALRRGATERARAAFSELASWGASKQPSGPYGDTWGGSGLSALGLWRWLQIVDKQGPGSEGEVDRVLTAAATLQKTRLYSGMVRSGLLPGLPLLAEEVADTLAHVAWKNQKQEKARELYLDFLEIDSRGELDGVDREIQAQLLERRLVSRERLGLFRARRQLALVKTRSQKDEAASALRKLWEDAWAPADVRAEAGYEWAYYSRSRYESLGLDRVLTEVISLAGDDMTAARALYRRGLERGGQGLADDLIELRRRFPKSSLADDALYQLATHYFFRPDLDSALRYYRELRQFEGPNDFRDSAYYLPAIGLLKRNRAGDLDAAAQLLDEYLKKFPDNFFRPRALFWLGRIAEQKDDREQARKFFAQVAGEAPYDYYGLRARLHLEEGAEAARHEVPPPASRVREELREAYGRSHPETRLLLRSPYHGRLDSAGGKGLYERLLAAELECRKALGKRLDAIPLKVLAEERFLPAVAVLLALRQDALAARDREDTADNRLRLGGFLGHRMHDWPIAVEVTFLTPLAPRARFTEVQNDPRYLATEYPAPASLTGLNLQAALAAVGWPIHGSPTLSQSVMYALIRRESRFDPGAISKEGALGLFQMMPATFAKLDRRKKLLQSSGINTAADFLLDPGRNIATAGAWWRSEFGRDTISDAVMKHNAGPDATQGWMPYWSSLNAMDDYEYRVETVRFPEPRTLLRNVLQDTIIVDGSGLFATGVKR